ncbi:MAG: R3H domain-containing nucleic acid-binding protein [bacterium]
MIEEIIEEFFEKMTLPITIESCKNDGQLLKVALSSSDAQTLIGYQGSNLSDIQSLLARILRKKINQEILLDLDINGYKSDKEQRFCDLAQDAADEAVATGREKVLFPMNAFERRIIHTELTKRSDVKTESIGQGDTRKVVVFPV